MPLDDVSPFGDLLADPDELRARRMADQRERQYLEDLRDVARTPAGKRVLVVLLDRLGAHRPAWRGNSSIHRECALKDFADDVLNDLALADEDAFLNLSRAMRAVAATTEDRP